MNYSQWQMVVSYWRPEQKIGNKLSEAQQFTNLSLNEIDRNNLLIDKKDYLEKSLDLGDMDIP